MVKNACNNEKGASVKLIGGKGKYRKENEKWYEREGKIHTNVLRTK